jgi:hypothetical protein
MYVELKVVNGCKSEIILECIIYRLVSEIKVLNSSQSLYKFYHKLDIKRLQIWQRFMVILL